MSLETLQRKLFKHRTLLISSFVGIMSAAMTGLIVSERAWWSYIIWGAIFVLGLWVILKITKRPPSRGGTLYSIIE